MEKGRRAGFSLALGDIENSFSEWVLVSLKRGGWL